MSVVFAAMRLLAFSAVMISVALLHHGHIQAFLSDVAQRSRGRRSLRGSKLIQHSSDLQVYFGHPATHYEVAIHRKTRSLEVGLHFEGQPSDNMRHLAHLADRAAEIRARLGSHIEFEQWTRQWTRVHDSRILTPADVEWSPKHDLTRRLAEETAGRLTRFIDVLQPMLEEKRR